MRRALVLLTSTWLLITFLHSVPPYLTLIAAGLALYTSLHRCGGNYLRQVFKAVLWLPDKITWRRGLRRSGVCVYVLEQIT